MRFAAIHKLASYLLIAAGFAALGLSGELSPAVLITTALLGTLSYFFDPARFALLRAPVWKGAWTLVTVSLAAWLGSSVLRGQPVLLAGAHALCVLLVNKLWNRRSSRDWLQAYAVSFLMLVAATVLNTALVFAATFVVYVIAATWALTLLHLRREMEDNYLLKHSDASASEPVEVSRVLSSKRVVGGAFLAGTSAISVGIFVASGLFFLLFPRVGLDMFASHARRGLRIGFSDRGVELGENGLVRDNDAVVMRVVFPRGAPPTTPLYFRGIAFDTYRDGRWSPSDGGGRSPLKRWAGMSLVGVPHSILLDPRTFKQRLASTVEQEIYLEPMDASVLFAAERPIAFTVPTSRPGGPRQPTPEGLFLDAAGRFSTDDVYAAGRQAGIKYTARSRLEPPPPAELSRIPPATPEEQEALAAYLDVSGVPDEVLQLGRRITADARGPFAKTLAVQRYLQQGYRYTLKLSHDPKKEPLAEFLFERQQGHCEYFASAMAILLRAAGVPTRHVAGFYGGEWNEVGQYLQVRQRNAHAWVEVYLGAAGWVHFDATPPAASLPGLGGPDSRLGQLLDVLQLAWFKYVIEYDLTTQVDLLSHFRRAASEWSWGGKRRNGGAIWARVRPRTVGLAASGLVLVGWLAWRRRRPRGAKAGRPRVAPQAASALARAMRALERRGISRSPADTPRSLGAHAAALGDPGARAFADLVELYYEARFGLRPVDTARLDALAHEVAHPPPPASAPHPSSEPPSLGHGPGI